MPDRRSFLTKLGVTGLLLAAASPAGAEPAPDEPAAGSPPASPEAKASAKPAKGPSTAAIAIAATMRRFDAKLSDTELATIATSIDDNASAGAALNPKKRRLKNSDEPVTHFAATVR